MPRQGYRRYFVRSFEGNNDQFEAWLDKVTEQGLEVVSILAIDARCDPNWGIYKVVLRDPATRM